MDWVGANNIGISHFGIHPSQLPPAHIRFDTLHMNCAIARNLITLRRIFILNQLIATILSSKILDIFWNNFLLFVWWNNKNFSSFNDNKLILFVSNVNILTEFMSKELVQSKEVDNIILVCRVWSRIW